MNKILEIKNLSYSITDKNILGSTNAVHILRNISFDLNKGEILGIAGESGSGKTTLGKIITGIINNYEGRIKITQSEELNKTKTSTVQILFQNNGEILNPFRKISDIVSETIITRNGNKDNIDDKLEKIFTSVNFPVELRNKKGFQLSGGEQQRAALARILAARPSLIILDEPFSAQDPESQLNLVELFKKINSEFNISMICIAHNLGILRKLCNKILIMYKGEVVEQGNCNEIFASPKHAYTKYLLRAEKYSLSYDELKFIPEN